METPKAKRKGLRIFFAVVAAFYAIAFLEMMWEDHVFNRMTPAQHLEAAKRLLDVGDQQSGEVGLRHLGAIPHDSPVAKDVPEIETRLKMQGLAAREAATAAQNAKAARTVTITKFQTDLRNLGYDLNVDDSDLATELDITSEDFNDTDHRVRFLAFLRGKNAPTFGVCWEGFRTIRLKSSKVPLVGFNETYPLDCDR